MKIDIEKEREWWERNPRLHSSRARRVAKEYLDKLEVVQGLLVESDREVACLRAQLADQRAQAIRMLAYRELDRGMDEAKAIAQAAYNYDRLSAIPVPPPKSEKAGES